MKCKYFKIQELVSADVYKKYGEGAWKFIDEKLIITIDEIREHFNKPILINSYKRNLHQRGLRANKDTIVRNKKGYYISQHCLGKAVDFNVVGMSIEDAYNELVKHHKKFKYLKRIENIKHTPTWIHIDVANVDDFKIFEI